jgi:hypothetical protein
MMPVPARFLLAAFLVFFQGPLTHPGGAPLPADALAADVPAFRVPPRETAAVGGAEFASRIAGLERAERERRILEEVSRGNIPAFLRRLRPVRLTGRVGDRFRSATVWVMPDYLAVGSDEDFVRVPVSLDTALTIARSFGMGLPTARIVDAVYAQSRLRLPPSPMPPGPRMTSAAYFVAHNDRIERQRAGRGLGELIAGHKKDLVLTNRLFSRATRRVAIYGWHRGLVDPIQPLSVVHSASYADYSHGLRLVGAVAVVDGVSVRFLDALRDPAMAGVLDREGRMRIPVALLTGEARRVGASGASAR